MQVQRELKREVRCLLDDLLNRCLLLLFCLTPGPNPAPCPTFPCPDPLPLYRCPTIHLPLCHPAGLLSPEVAILLYAASLGQNSGLPSPVVPAHRGHCISRRTEQIVLWYTCSPVLYRCARWPLMFFVSETHSKFSTGICDSFRIMAPLSTRWNLL